MCTAYALIKLPALLHIMYYQLDWQGGARDII